MSHKAIDRQASKMTTASSPASGESKEKKSVARYILFKFNLLKGIYIHFSAKELYRCLHHEEVQVRLKFYDVTKNTKLKKKIKLMLDSCHVT